MENYSYRRKKERIIIFTGKYIHKNDLINKIEPSESLANSIYNNETIFKDSRSTKCGNLYYYI